MGKRKRPPPASPAVKYKADLAEARSEGRDIESVPVPPELGPPPLGASIAITVAAVPAKKPKRKPVRYTNEIAKKILDRLEAGESLLSICRDDGMPSEAAVRKWAKKEPFGSKYTRAREAGFRVLAEQIVDISDNPDTDQGAVARDRLRVDSRKWLLSKMLPKEFGDKLEVSGDADRPPFMVIERRIVDPAQNQGSA